MSRKHFYLIFTLIAALLLCNSSLFGWDVINIGSGSGYHKPVVKFGPSGMLYIVYKGESSVYLQSYDGKDLKLIGQVSSTAGNTAYEPFVAVDANENVHVAWCEYSQADRHHHHVKYRKFDGKNWTNEVTVKTFAIHAIEDLRMAVDNSGNVFIVGSEESGGSLFRAFLLCKYGDTVTHDTFDKKHAWVDVDDNFVHVVWQGKHGGEYSIWYGKKENKANGAWLKKEAKTSHDSARPSIQRTADGTLHITYNHEAYVAPNIIQREIWYFNSTDNGETFNKGSKVKSFGITHSLDISSANGVTYLAAQDGASAGGSGVLYSVNKGNGWSEMAMIPGTGGCKLQGSAVSPDGSVYATGFTKYESSVHLAVEGTINVVPPVDITLTLDKAEKKTIRTLLFKKSYYKLGWTLNNNSNETLDKIEIKRKEQGQEDSAYILIDTVASTVAEYSDNNSVDMNKNYEYKIIVYWTDKDGNKGWTDSKGESGKL